MTNSTGLVNRNSDPISKGRLKIAVLVCSYLRSSSLSECLKALATQTRRADEVVIVLRPNDTASQQTACSAPLKVRTLLVNAQGVIAATNLGLGEVSGDIVALTDDDAKPCPNWLEEIERVYLRSDRIGAVGGRDRLHIRDRKDLLNAFTSEKIGAISTTGHITGFHHCRTKVMEQSVDFLKGVNLSFRRVAIEGIEIDTNLRGRGAQPAWEMDLCLKVKARGYHILFSQNVIVDHYIAPRLDDDERTELMTEGGAGTSFNVSYLVFIHARLLQQCGYLARTLLFGTRRFPGIAAAIYSMMRADPSGVRKMIRIYKLTTQAWLKAKSAKKLWAASSSVKTGSTL